METIQTTAQLMEQLPRISHSANDVSRPELGYEERLHYSSVESHVEQSNNVLRRQYRSECSQLSPTSVHSQSSEQNGHEHETVCKTINGLDYRNLNTSAQSRTAFQSNGNSDAISATNGKRAFAHHESHKPNDLQQKENIKENISMDDTDIIPGDYSDFHYEKLPLYNEKKKKTSFVSNLEDESEVISIANDDFSDADNKLIETKCRNETSALVNNENNVSTRNGEQRRTRAHSDSEQSDFYQVPKQQAFHHEQNSAEVSVCISEPCSALWNDK